MLQISPIPPVPYGERFIKFIHAITKSGEEAVREKENAQSEENNSITTEPARYLHEGMASPNGHLGGLGGQGHGLVGGMAHRSSLTSETSDEKLGENEREAHKTERRGASENLVPDRTIKPVPVRSPSQEAGQMAGMTLPIVEEAGEGSSSRSAGSNFDLRDIGGRPPPTPPKDIHNGHLSPMGRMLQPPAVPPKEPSLYSRPSYQGSTRSMNMATGRNSYDSNKALPMLPRGADREAERARDGQGEGRPGIQSRDREQGDEEIGRAR